MWKLSVGLKKLGGFLGNWKVGIAWNCCDLDDAKRSLTYTPELLEEEKK